MAKARTATVVLDEETAPPADPLDGIDDVTSDEITQAFGVTDEIRSTTGVTLQFTRVWPATPGVQGHCGTMGAAEYTLEEAAKRFGPGKYTVRLKDGANKYMRGGGTLNIAGNPSASAGPTQASSTGGNETVALLEAMNRRADDAERAADARREKFWALALAAVPIIPSIIAAMRGSGGDSTAALITALKPAPAPSLAEVVTTLQGLKALGNDKPATDPLEQLAKLMGIAKEMSGGGGDGEGGAGSNWIDLVRDGLKAAPDLLGALQTRGPQMVPVQVVSQPVPQGTIAPQPQQDAPAQPAAGGEQDMWILIQPILRGIAGNIEKWAKEGKNAALRAEVLLDDLPEWLAEKLQPKQALEFLNHPQWWDYLVQFHPPLANYRPWVEQLRATLIEIVTEQLTENANASDESDSKTETGNEGSPGR